ncbi:MAG: electron transport complex subunit E [Clostridia bacterium]|nr:electron transport complex subunit E [Clostridia bacterium]
MKKGFFANHLKDGILYKNPILVQFIGMCPTLATTTSATNALAMGIAVTVVLAFSNLFISLLRKFIPSEVRIAGYIVIISAFVTVVEMVMHAYFVSLYSALGVFIPLIVVNCLILARAEAFASKNPPIPSLWDGICMGLGFTVALTLLGAIREILGAGSIFGFTFLPEIMHVSMLVLPAGAFIALGFLVAGMNKLMSKFAEKKEDGADV